MQILKICIAETQTHLFTSAVCIKPDVMCIVPNVLKGIAVNVLQEDNKYPASSQLIYLLHSTNAPPPSFHECTACSLRPSTYIFHSVLSNRWSQLTVNKAKVQQAGVYVYFLSFD